MRRRRGVDQAAAALAAGCPVVVKGRPAHPATGAQVAEAIGRAVDFYGLLAVEHPGCPPPRAGRRADPVAFARSRGAVIV